MKEASAILQEHNNLPLRELVRTSLNDMMARTRHPESERQSPDLTRISQAEVALAKGLPAGQEARQRSRRPDDDHVQVAVVGADRPARLDDRQHLPEVRDEDLGGLHDLGRAVEGDLVIHVLDRAGLAGCLYAYNFGSVSSDRFDAVTALSLIAFAYAGGITLISGAVFAGLISAQAMIPYALQDWFGLDGNWFLLFGGVVLIFTLLQNPTGVAGDFYRRLHKKPQLHAPESSLFEHESERVGRGASG